MLKNPSIRAAFASIKGGLFQLSVISCMAAIGLWGHKTHWQFSSHAQAHTPEAPAPIVPEISQADSAQPKIEFPTLESVQESGMHFGTPEHRALASEVRASGIVTYDPTRLAQLSARVSGTVWRIEKQVGQTINANDVLAIIDAPAVGQAKADFLRSIADVQLREKLYQRLQSFENGEVPVKQVQEAETELRKARVEMFNAQQALISLGFTIDLDEWRQLTEDDLQNRIKFLGLPKPIVEQLDPNSTTAALLPIFAPFKGIVIGRDLAKGEVVAPQQSHFDIADVSRMWIVMNVREKDVDDLRLGQKVKFTSGNATVESAISWMSTSVDEKTRTVEVRCEVENPELPCANNQPSGRRQLRANLFGVGEICLHESNNALVVPTSAVQWYVDHSVVFVRTGETTFEPRTVKLGIVDGEYTEILAGLQPDENLVVAGSHVLKAEMQRSAAGSSPP